MWESSGLPEAGRARCSSCSTGTAPDPGRIHAGQAGVATLSDPRLDFLASLHKPKKVTPGFGRVSRHARLDARLPCRQPPASRLDPRRRCPADRLERFLRRRSRQPSSPRSATRCSSPISESSPPGVERLEASLKKPRPDRELVAKELEIVKAVHAVLEEGKTVASLDLSAEDKKPLRSFGLLTDKPEVVLLNTLQGQSIPDALKALAPEALAIDAKLELELSQLDPEERAAFMTDMGVSELGKDRIIRRAYDAVGIITFFTAGEPEVRGWNLERGATAVAAAGKIHTDLAKGFIRAEVTAYDDLYQAGSVKEAKARHLQRLEGKEYIVKDGDVVYFRSAV